MRLVARCFQTFTNSFYSFFEFNLWNPTTFHQFLNFRIYIDNTSIGDIQKDKEVQVEVVSLSRNDYGVLTSKIAEVSDDVVMDSNSGRKFYTAKCSLDRDFMTSRSGEKVPLRNGMEAKVSIIRGRMTYFDYIWGKLR